VGGVGKKINKLDWMRSNPENLFRDTLPLTTLTRTRRDGSSSHVGVAEDVIEEAYLEARKGGAAGKAKDLVVSENEKVRTPL
jgi:hypothetical protein